MPKPISQLGGAVPYPTFAFNSISGNNGSGTSRSEFHSISAASGMCHQAVSRLQAGCGFSFSPAQ